MQKQRGGGAVIFDDGPGTMSKKSPALRLEFQDVNVDGLTKIIPFHPLSGLTTATLTLRTSAGDAIYNWSAIKFFTVHAGLNTLFGLLGDDELTLSATRPFRRLKAKYHYVLPYSGPVTAVVITFRNGDRLTFDGRAGLELAFTAEQKRIKPSAKAKAAAV